jgi:hypothetical protein
LLQQALPGSVLVVAIDPGKADGTEAHCSTVTSLVISPS